MKNFMRLFKGPSMNSKAEDQQLALGVITVTSQPVEDLDVVPATGPTPRVQPTAIKHPALKPSPKAAGVKKVMLDEAGVSILDLRELPSSRFRIVGSAYWVTDSGRYKHGGNEYLLVREPKNKWDAHALAVYGKGRKVGYLTEARAAALAPIMDKLPFDAYRVGGAPPASNSITMWVDIPALPKFRAFAETVRMGISGN